MVKKFISLRPLPTQGTGSKGVWKVRAHWKKWAAAVVIAAVLVAGSCFIFLAGRGRVSAPAFSVGDTWSWAGTTQAADNENITTFTRVDSVTGKHTRLGRECLIFRSVGAENAGYSLDYHYTQADGWYTAGSESFLDNLKMGEMTPAGPILSIEFPLEVGKKWVDITAVSGYDNTLGLKSMNLQVISNGEVLSVGAVTVPAGTFQAYEIKFTTLLNGAGRATVENQELTAQILTTITGTRWYSDTVKNFVKTTSDTTTMTTVLWETTTIKTHAEMELTGYSLGG